MKWKGWIFLVMLVLMGSPTNLTHAETISKNEYLNRIIVLFKQFLQMESDAVFMNYAQLKPLIESGAVLPNRIRGTNPPGGFFARPPGSDWLKRVQALRNVKIEGGDIGCFDLPKLPSGSGVCGFDLLGLYSAVLGKSPMSRLDEIASKFWLATICHETPTACKAMQRWE